MFTIRRGPVLLWSVTTTVQRTNERAAGITGTNPVTIQDYYRVAAFEVRCITNVNLNLSELRIFGAYAAAGVNPAGLTASVFCLPVNGTAPLLTTGTGAIAQGVLRLNNTAGSGGPGLIVPPVLLLEYSTAAPGATPNLVFEVHGTFYGSPYYITEP